MYAPLLAIAAKQILDGKCEEASAVFAAAATTMYVQLGPRKVMEGMTKAFREWIKGESEQEANQTRQVLPVTIHDSLGLWACRGVITVFCSAKAVTTTASCLWSNCGRAVSMSGV